ncbi:CMGC kinase [Fusarium napiforme]|uniref:non-specific serine/threonine protein kinase n=1 Tax=Fusarium napiforme TaxID=42672 RepID=A0A8H5NJB7_9HYPO|nr:CMGC kinase [Fusarium napiforme]
MNRVPTTDSPPNGSTQPAPLIEESILEQLDAQDWGDFVDSDEEPDVEFACEDINLYPRGFCYPISIGEIIIERYRIIHKLGHGAFSTVWMAHGIIENKDVALKILTLGNSNERDYQMQSEIIGTAKDLTYLLVYHQTFLLPSPHSQHRVFVFPLQGPNLRNHPPRKLPITTKMAFAVQLLKALKSLHEVGILHADLNTANIMYTLHPLNSSVSEKYKQVGRPRKMILWTEQWKDGELFTPMKPKEDLIGDSIVLGDFGLAHKAGSPTRKMQSPATYCAPERLHNINPSYGSDIWSYMYPEFDLKERLGQLRPDVGARELELVVSVLRRGLVYQHEERIAAAELLEHDSFKELMSMYTH